MGRVLVREESSSSRTGKHKWRSLFFVLKRNCSEAGYKILNERRVKGRYCRGSAIIKELEIPDDAFVVKLDFCLNLRRRLKGRIIVTDSNDEVLGEAVYRKLKIRFKYLVSSEIIELVKCVFHKLKLPVKRYAVIKH